MNENAKKPNSQNNKRRPKRPGQQAEGHHNKKRPSSKGKRPSNNNRRYRSNKNKYASKLTSIQAIFTKYDNLLENYLKLRTKYFEYFYRDSSKQKTKVFDNYGKALVQLRNFTKQLSEYQLEKFQQRGFFKYDHTYCENHSIDPELTSVEVAEEGFDPHINSVQASRQSFQDDTEESTGTIEDYNSYKGL